MMKRLAVVLALVPMLASANELAPGTFEVVGGSNLGFRSGSIKVDRGAGEQTTDTTDYGLNASGLYYVIPNLGVGLSLQYSNSSEKAGGVTNGLSTFLLGPTVAYEVPVAPQFAVFGRGFVGYATSTATETGSPDVSGSGYGFELAAGGKYFVVKNFSFDAALAYDYSKLTFDKIGAIEPKSTTSGFGLQVGLSVYFGGGK